ncbi:MAG TPA: ATP-binding protein, partial [Thermodesulfobacteriota bacterium]|nr:ATP-binding protein [Thermodesulfobacteriota bacterium]
DGLLALEKEPDDEPTVDSLFRHYHSLKGMSASMGYDPIMRFSHAQEDLLSGVRSRELQVTPGLISTLFEALDALKELVGRVEEGRPLEVDVTPLVEKIKVCRKDAEEAEERPSEVPKHPHQAPPAHQAPQPPQPPQATGKVFRPPELKLSNVMKVEGSVFDELLTTVGDLFMVLNSFKTFSHSLRSIEFKDDVHTLGKTLNELYSRILTARTIPIGDLTHSLPRVVRDISRRGGKSVELRIEGEDISLDRSVLEDLGSPLVHLIRNAVDHGIEAPEERKTLGKPPSGTIRVRAYPKKDRVVLEVSDDGAGIDPESVRRKAVERGLPPELVRTMSEKEVFKLVCLQGLSTSREVTDTSGRGVGMDVVKNAVEGLGGTLDIESKAAAGTTVRMELPKTTSIIKALVVEVSDERLLVPISRIEKVLEVENSLVSGGFFRYGEKEIPLVHLGTMLGIEENEPGPERAVVVVEYERPASKFHPDPPEALGTGHAGVVVDGYGLEIDAYVRPLTPPLSRLWGVSGITIMGDGRPVFLVDLAQVISRAPGFAPTTRGFA